MSAARINGTTVTRLDGKAEPVDVVTEDDAKDAGKVARAIAKLQVDSAGLRRRFAPDRIDFEDVAVPATGATAPVSLQHGLAGRVRWWVVDWVCATNVAPILRKDDTNTTSDTLVLLSYVAGTATVRVEAAG